MEQPLVTLPVDDTEDFAIAPGWRSCIVDNLAIRICPMFDIDPPQLVLASAVAKKSELRKMNLNPPRAKTAGYLGRGSGRGRFDINEGP